MNTTKIKGFNVGLKSVYGEYNCGNKTVGRLELVVTDKDRPNINLGVQDLAEQLVIPSVNKKVINNYLEDLNSIGTFGKLNANSPMFPNDGGVYPPGVLVYADSIYINKAYTWWNNWKCLIEEFEADPSYGVSIIKSPIMPNKYYGTGKPSRLWLIVLPSISKHICWDKSHVSTGMKESLKSTLQCDWTSPALTKELKSLGVSV